MLHEVQPGQSVADGPHSAAQWNEMVRLTRREVTGPRVVKTAAGWHIADRPRVASTWLFAVGIHEDGVVLAKEAFKSETGMVWQIALGPNNATEFNPFPNSTPEHFVPFVIRQDPEIPYEVGSGIIEGQPFDTDNVCILVAGFIVPWPRFLYVTPASVDELCEPCAAGRGASAPAGTPRPSPTVAVPLPESVSAVPLVPGLVDAFIQQDNPDDCPECK